MPDLPLPIIRPEDVSPDSPRILMAWAKFVVGWWALDGHGFYLRSQHRSQRAAEGARLRVPWLQRKQAAVYRVERGT